jgi:hypothetical protein
MILILVNFEITFENNIEGDRVRRVKERAYYQLQQQ